MRETSVRSRATIVTFSARAVGEERMGWTFASSCAGVAPRGAVPFMGRVRMRSPSQSKNSSGETDSTCSSPLSMQAT
ncbi:MAG: hypothetical protein GAK34_01198 [Delftia tsuruhatensis]|nr:MAG: hypothetical protein GAK34_01198 [Delftia tsuruhatensis]